MFHSFTAAFIGRHLSGLSLDASILPDRLQMCSVKLLNPQRWNDPKSQVSFCIRIILSVWVRQLQAPMKSSQTSRTQDGFDLLRLITELVEVTDTRLSHFLRWIWNITNKCFLCLQLTTTCALVARSPGIIKSAQLISWLDVLTRLEVLLTADERLSGGDRPCYNKLHPLRAVFSQPQTPLYCGPGDADMIAIVYSAALICISVGIPEVGGFSQSRKGPSAIKVQHVTDKNRPRETGDVGLVYWSEMFAKKHSRSLRRRTMEEISSWG